MSRKEETVIMIGLLVFLLVVALKLPAIDAEAQGPQPHVTWGKGSHPWYVAGAYKVPALCLNSWGAHVPCPDVPSYAVWR